MSSLSIKVESNGVAILSLDTPDSAENRLNQESFTFLEEFLNRLNGELDMVENDDEIKAVVILSGKENSFITGADFREYLEFTLADEGRSYSLKLQELSEKIENSRVPFVASVSGACLGIGLELAIACRYRLASDNRHTVFGLDQINLGLVPCAGGVPRLARLIGTKETLDMIVTGQTLDPYYARQVGLVDEIVPEELLKDISVKRALELANKEIKPRRQRFGGMASALINENPVSRRMSFEKAKKQIKESRELYVNALRMAVEALEVGVSSFNRGLHVESVYFGELAVTSYSRQLIRARIALEEIRNDPSYKKAAQENKKKIDKIAVVGDEHYVSGIACLAADNGIRVRIKGRDNENAGTTLKKSYDFFMGKLVNGEIGELDAEKKLDLISAASDYSGFKRAQIVIESAGEDLDVKQRVLKEIESLSGSDFVYVSNSFALPIERIAVAASRPEKIIGVKISSPLSEAELLEIAVSDNTSKETIGNIVEFGRRIGKLPLVVKDKKGFYTTRIQLAYFNEALNLLGEGVGAEDIEEAMTLFGFTDGPLGSMDEIGIDLVKKGYEILYSPTAENSRAYSILDTLIAEGRRGVKDGRGFYRHGGHDKKIDRSIYKLLSLHEEDSNSVSHEFIQDRLILALVNHAMICLQEEVIENAKEGDVGALMGIGFPTYRGGPFSYVDSVGAGEIMKKLHNLSVRYGNRYTPPTLLKNMAVGGSKFYES